MTSPAQASPQIVPSITPSPSAFSDHAATPVSTSWISFNSLVISLLIGIGVGIGVAAAFLTYRQCRASNDGDSEAERKDALERLKIWYDFWKYFLVSFALVLITTLLGNTLKDRELKFQEAKQKGDLDLEKEKQISASLLAENTNLGSFLDRALVDSWEKQYAFASYFSHLSSNADSKSRWDDYAAFIVRTRTETAKVEEEYNKKRTKISEMRKANPSDPRIADEEKDLLRVQSELELNQAVLQPKSSVGNRFHAAKQNVSNRGAPPDSFLDELVAWGKTAPDDIFASDNSEDSKGVYTRVKPLLGPFQSPLHRRAVMLEVMRVLAGFESDWNWNLGSDVTSPSSITPETREAGAWQVDATSINFGPELKSLVSARLGKIDPVAFQSATKTDHSFAMEYVARLLRRTTQTHGYFARNQIDSWLRRDSVAEFESLIAGQSETGVTNRTGTDLSTSTPPPKQIRAKSR